MGSVELVDLDMSVQVIWTGAVETAGLGGQSEAGVGRPDDP